MSNGNIDILCNVHGHIGSVPVENDGISRARNIAKSHKNRTPCQLSDIEIDETPLTRL